jgi:hypothetical protein
VTEELKPLPLLIEVFLLKAVKGMHQKSKALRRHEKHLLDSLRVDPELRNQVNSLFERSARLCGKPARKSIN